MESILFTISKRPYVFIFLLSFLFLCIRQRGLKSTLLFLVLGYTIAWASEALSIRTGFPYGWYFYIYENLQGEILNAGVPVWDSLSYSFLCFAGLSVAEKIGVSKTFRLRRGDRPVAPTRKEPIVVTAVWAALFVTLLDIVIDPLAHQGDRWFLGKIYYYPHPGFYFDVPISNFLGWFAVAFIIVSSFLFLEKKLSFRKEQKVQTGLKNMIDSWGGVFFYFGIFIFNWGITLWLKEWALVFLDLLWMSLPLFLIKRNYYSGFLFTPERSPKR